MRNVDTVFDDRKGRRSGKTPNLWEKDSYLFSRLVPLSQGGGPRTHPLIRFSPISERNARRRRTPYALTTTIWRYSLAISRKTKGKAVIPQSSTPRDCGVIRPG